MLLESTRISYGIRPRSSQDKGQMTKSLWCDELCKQLHCENNVIDEG